MHEFDLNEDEPVGKTYSYAWFRTDSFILTHRQKGTRKSSECFWKPRKRYLKVAFGGAEVRFLLELRSRN